MQQADLSTADLLNRAIRSHIERVETVSLGKVVSYDESAETAVVRPSVKGFKVSDDGSGVEMFAMPDVKGPVLQFGAGGNTLYTPLSAGDDVLVLFAGRDIDNAIGGAQTPTDPNTGRRHHIMDALILPLPWLGVGASARTSSTPGAMVLGGIVQLGSGGAAEVLTTASKVYLRFLALKAAYDTHVHPDPVSGNTGVPTVLLPVDATWRDSLKADEDVKVKV